MYEMFVGADLSCPAPIYRPLRIACLRLFISYTNEYKIQPVFIPLGQYIP
jgi:hypothetical protein